MTVGLHARIGGVGLIAPGISDWKQGREILCGREPWQPGSLVIPTTELLPAAERRRTGQAVRLALACGHQAVLASGRPANELASVFASADVDADNTHQICVALNEAEPSLSPTRFHNSVQNAVSGYWTILTGSRAPTTMVMGTDEVFAMGLLEAMSQVVRSRQPVLLVVFDIPMPAPLYASHPIEGGGAIALVFEAGPDAGAGVGQGAGRGAGPTIGLQLVRDGRDLPDEPASRSGGDGADDGLNGLRETHPLGTALPLLALLAECSETAPQRAGGGGSPVAPNRPVALKFDRYHSLHVAVDNHPEAAASP